MAHVLILGAGSDIARALAARLAAVGYHLYLAGRNPAELEKDAQDLRLRYGIDAQAKAFDALAMDSHPAFWQDLEPKPYGVVSAVGLHAPQEEAEHDWALCRSLLDTNLTGLVSILNLAADHLEAQGRGFVIGLGSVAGDRGRRSNYLYGAAKAGFATYLSGLRARLSRVGVLVITVKPGYVRTKMTAGLALPEALVATPEQAAADIFHAFKEGKSEVYTRWFWRYIMLGIRLIPECIFKKLDI
ncbi:MAG: SDR family oxidoreductase [Thermodesulfobacteriota bacterium]